MTSMSSLRNVIPVSKHDYLEEDAEISGQKYVCLSFLSKKKILEDKNVFMFNKFTEYFCVEVKEMFENLMNKYPYETDGMKAIAAKYRYFFNHLVM